MFCSCACVASTEETIKYVYVAITMYVPIKMRTIKTHWLSQPSNSRIYCCIRCLAVSNSAGTMHWRTPPLFRKIAPAGLSIGDVRADVMSFLKHYFSVHRPRGGRVRKNCKRHEIVLWREKSHSYQKFAAGGIFFTTVRLHLYGLRIRLGNNDLEVA